MIFVDNKAFGDVHNELLSMKKFLLIVFVLSSMSCFGQKTTQENSDSLSLKRKLYSIPKIASSNQFDASSFLNRIDNQFKIPQSYLLPLLGLYKKDDFENKFLLDMNLTNQFMIDDMSSITTTHVQSNFIGLGGLNLVQGNYNFNVEDIIVFSPGIYAAKYNIYNDFLNDGGVNGNIKINLSENIKVNFFGQYSITGSKVAISPFISPLYPHSNFGSSLEFKVNNNWGVMMGAENEYDVFLRKWVTRPFIMPLFYKH